MTDQERLTCLFVRYHKALVGALRAYLDDEDARDVAQETFVAVFKSIGKYRGQAEWGYLKTAAMNLMRNHHRKRKTKRRGEDLTAPMEAVGEVPEEKRTVEEDLVLRERNRRFRQAYEKGLLELSELTRRCWLLRLEEKTTDEIARATGLTPDAVRSRISDARARLRKSIGDAADGIEWEEVFNDESES